MLRGRWSSCFNRATLTCWSSLTPWGCQVTSIGGRIHRVLPLFPRNIRDHHHNDSINHGLRCRRQLAGACKFTTHHHVWQSELTITVFPKRLMCFGPSPSKQNYFSPKRTMCSRKPNKCCEAKGKLPGCMSMHQRWKIYAHNTVGLQSGRTHGMAEHMLYCMPAAIYQTPLKACIDCQSPHLKSSRDIRYGGVRQFAWN